MSGIKGYLPEDYRPDNVDDLILPKQIKEQLKKFIDIGEIPCILMNGTAGTGKTASAIALCKGIGCEYELINGSKDMSMDRLRTDVMNIASTVSLFHQGHHKVIIIDEADGLQKPVQNALKTFIEEFSSTCRFIFTCNDKNKIIDPIISRCSNIQFIIPHDEKADLAKQIFNRILQILDEHKIEYNPKAVSEFVKQHFPDFRKMLNEIQLYSTNGKIDEGILSNTSESIVKELIDILKRKSFNDLYDWIAANAYICESELYDILYDNLYELIQPQSYAQLIIILDKYSMQSLTCANPKINMASAFIHIMNDCIFK